MGQRADRLGTMLMDECCGYSIVVTPDVLKQAISSLDENDSRALTCEICGRPIFVICHDGKLYTVNSTPMLYVKEGM